MSVAITYVGLAVLLGWALRGQYGHQLGAAIPGVLFSLSLVLVAGRDDWIQRAPTLAVAGAIGFSVGGSASYGRLIGYTRAKKWTNILYGFTCLFVVGALWGVIGGGIVGLALEPVPPRPARLAIFVINMAAGAVIAYDILIKRCGIRMTPPRSDAWAYEFGIALVLLTLLRFHGYDIALRCAIYGMFGYGLGFVVGNFIQVLGHVSGIRLGWWKVMEKTMGFVGGSVLSYGILTADIPVLPDVAGYVNWMGVAVVIGIPVTVLIRRLTVERLTNRLSACLFENTDQTVRSRLTTARVCVVVCAFATVLTVFLHEGGPIATRSGWLAVTAVFALSGILMSNLQSGFPRVPFESYSVEVSLWVELAVLIGVAVYVPFQIVGDHWWQLAIRLAGAATIATLLLVSTVSYFAMKDDLQGAHLRWGDGPETH